MRSSLRKRKKRPSLKKRKRKVKKKLENLRMMTSRRSVRRPGPRSRLSRTLSTVICTVPSR